MAALSPTRVVLAADTTVALDGVILGKPADRDEARAMLRSLAARSHQVLTGIAVAVVGTDGDAVVHSALDVTEVVVGEITEERLAWYVDSGDADDKAGAYGLQGAAGLFADRIEGVRTGSSVFRSPSSTDSSPLTVSISWIFGRLRDRPGRGDRRPCPPPCHPPARP